MTNSSLATLGLVFGVLLLSVFMTPLIRHYALRKCVLDIPNERSLHVIPKPRGGGIAIVVSSAVGMVALYLLSGGISNLYSALMVAGFIVAAVGFWDDRGHVPVRIRIIFHLMAAAAALIILNYGVETNGVSILGVVYHVFILIAMVWLLNLYNFMDGIDALAAAQAIFVFLSSAILFFIQGETNISILLIIFAASVIGFLIWNLPPARIFLGDVGSGYLGIVIGVLAAAGMLMYNIPFWSWVILLGSFLVDATVTVGRRLIRGTRWYEAHRSHAYQHAAVRMGGHGKVTIYIMLINVCWLFPWSVASLRWEGFGPLFATFALTPLVWLAIRLGAGLEQSDELRWVSQ